MIRGYWWLMVFPLLLIEIAYGGALAQEPSWQETVTNRKRPEVDALGINTGAYRIYPAVGLELVQDDNIFAVNTDEISDLITHIKPRVDLESDWTRNALNLTVNADIAQYKDTSSENYEDYLVGIDGRVDIQKGGYLKGETGYAREHVDRNSPNDINGIEPTVYNVSSLSVEYQYNPGRISLRLGGALDRRNYNDVATLSGTNNNDDQDRDELEALARIDYEMWAQSSVFFRVRYKSVKYDQQFDENGLQRSSEGNVVEIGIDLPFNGVLFGEIFAGHVTRDYDDSLLESIDLSAGGGALSWQPTGLTTVNVSIAQDVSESIVGISSGIFTTEGKLLVDHELLRNLLLSASLTTSRDDFIGIEREDDYTGFGVGAKYLMNRYLHVSLGYVFEDRDSNTPGGGNNYTNNVLLLAIKGQL